MSVIGKLNKIPVTITLRNQMSHFLEDTDTNSTVDSEIDSDIDSDIVSGMDSDLDSDITESDADFDTNVNDDPTITYSNDPASYLTDIELNNSTDTTEKTFYQTLECEPLDDTWMCSSGSKNHSLCIKFCSIG